MLLYLYYCNLLFIFISNSQFIQSSSYANGDLINMIRHLSHKCRIVSKLQASEDIVTQKKLCFLRVKANYNAKNCDKHFTCFKCKVKRHVSICTYIRKDSDKSKHKNRIAKFILKILRMTKRKMKIKMKLKRKMLWTLK